MKNFGFCTLFSLLIIAGNSQGQVRSVEQEIVAMANDPRYLNYEVAKLANANYQRSNPLDPALGELIQSGKLKDICSEESKQLLSAVNGGLNFANHLCAQNEIFNELKLDYPNVMKDPGLINKSFQHLTKKSTQYAKEFKQYTGVDLMIY